LARPATTVTDQLDAGADYRAGCHAHLHRDQVEQFIEKGRDLEKIVLSRAVRWHLEHRILFYGNKTVVFG